MDRKTLKEVCENYSEFIAPPFDLLYNVGGFEAIMVIAEMFGGTTTYIPTSRKIFAKCVEMAVSKDFDGFNVNAVRLKYGLTDVTMRKLLKA